MFFFKLIFIFNVSVNRLRLNEALKAAGYDIDGEKYPEGYQEAPLAYDAVWAVALGMYLFKAFHTGRGPAALW